MYSRVESKNSLITESQTFRKNILCFHKLTDKFTYGSTNYSPRRFALLIEYLANVGFNLASLKESISTKKQTNFAITFDDGYAHLIHTLPPFIEKYGIKPTIFVPTAFIGKKNSWDYSSYIKSESHLEAIQITELAAMGAEFGSHGHGHIDLTRCSSAILKEELYKSKSILESITGRIVESFSYPFGRFNADTVLSVKNAGYVQALTMHYPIESDSSFTLGRVPIYFFDYPLFVGQKLSGARSRNVHQKLNRFINALSYGTTILNRFTGRNEN